MTGSERSRLIIIRGNSGSGKSQLARAIRAARPRGVAIIGHDVLRREILHVRDHPGALSVPYIDLSARFALDNGLDVVIEGILHSESYGEMLTQLRHDHVGVTRCYYYELALEETLRRHRTKALAAEVSESDVASWYRRDDRVAELDESVFDVGVSAADALDRVLTDAGWRSHVDDRLQSRWNCFAGSASGRPLLRRRNSGNTANADVTRWSSASTTDAKQRGRGTAPAPTRS